MLRDGGWVLLECQLERESLQLKSCTDSACRELEEDFSDEVVDDRQYGDLNGFLDKVLLEQPEEKIFRKTDIRLINGIVDCNVVRTTLETMPNVIKTLSRD